MTEPTSETALRLIPMPAHGGTIAIAHCSDGMEALARRLSKDAQAMTPPVKKAVLKNLKILTPIIDMAYIPPETSVST